MRLRQCLSEASYTMDPSSKKAHQLNALKYFTALPVILSSHFMTEWEFASLSLDYNESEWNHNIVYWIW